MVLKAHLNGVVQKIDTGIAHIAINNGWQKLRLPHTYLPDRGRYGSARYDINLKIHRISQDESSDIESASTTIHSQGERHPWEITGGEALLLTDFDNEYDAALISETLPSKYPDWLKPHGTECYVTLQLEYNEQRTLKESSYSPKQLEELAGVVDRTTPGVRCRWQFEPDDQRLRLSSPEITDEAITVEAEDRLYAFDPDTGQMLWQREAAGDPTVDVDPSPSSRIERDRVDSSETDLVYRIDNRERTISAINPETDDRLWTHEPGGHARLTTVVTPAVVYAAQSRSLSALDAHTGACEWTVDVDDQIWNFTLSGGTLFFGTSNGTCYAVDAATGEIQWTAAINETVKARPVVAEKTLIVGTLRGTLLSFDAETGAKHWETKLSSGVDYRASPLVSDTVVYVPAGETLHAFELESGNPLWRYQCSRRIRAEPAVDASTVYVAARSNLSALKATGSTQIPLRGIIETLENDDTIVRIRLADDESDSPDETLQMPPSALPYYAAFEQAHLEVFFSIDTDYETITGERQRESPYITEFSTDVTSRDDEFVTLALATVEGDAKGEVCLQAERVPTDLRQEGDSGYVSVYVEFDEDATPIEAIPELYRGDN